jgi:hypothetical protein
LHSAYPSLPCFFFHAFAAVGDFFSALDTQLRVHHMRLADFVAAFDLSPEASSRGLDSDEFARLVAQVLPGATACQVGGWVGVGRTETVCCNEILAWSDVM